VVPLIRGGRLVATLAVNQRAPRAWTPEELATASADVLYRMSPDWSEMRQLDAAAWSRLVAERRALGVTLAEVGQELDVRPRRSRLEVRRDHAPSARVRSATHVPRP